MLANGESDQTHLSPHHHSTTIIIIIIVIITNIAKERGISYAVQ
jgi:hypothetical protein